MAFLSQWIEWTIYWLYEIIKSNAFIHSYWIFSDNLRTWGSWEISQISLHWPCPFLGPLLQQEPMGFLSPWVSQDISSHPYCSPPQSGDLSMPSTFLPHQNTPLLHLIFCFLWSKSHHRHLLDSSLLYKWTKNEWETERGLPFSSPSCSFPSIWFVPLSRAEGIKYFNPRGSSDGRLFCPHNRPEEEGLGAGERV